METFEHATEFHPTTGDPRALLMINVQAVEISTESFRKYFVRNS
jgi:hypothetical protein